MSCFAFIVFHAFPFGSDLCYLFDDPIHVTPWYLKSGKVADADVSSEPLALARYRRAQPSEGPSCLNPIGIYRIVQLVQRIRKLNTFDMPDE